MSARDYRRRDPRARFLGARALAVDRRAHADPAAPGFDAPTSGSAAQGRVDDRRSQPRRLRDQIDSPFLGGRYFGAARRIVVCHSVETVGLGRASVVVTRRDPGLGKRLTNRFGHHTSLGLKGQHVALVAAGLRIGCRTSKVAVTGTDTLDACRYGAGACRLPSPPTPLVPCRS